MSKIKDMIYDIEHLYIAGFSARSIAQQLGMPYTEVLAVLDSWCVADSQHDRELYNPYSEA